MKHPAKDPIFTKELKWPYFLFYGCLKNVNNKDVVLNAAILDWIPFPNLSRTELFKTSVKFKVIIIIIIIFFTQRLSTQTNKQNYFWEIAYSKF